MARRESKENIANVFFNLETCQDRDASALFSTSLLLIPSLPITYIPLFPYFFRARLPFSSERNWKNFASYSLRRRNKNARGVGKVSVSKIRRRVKFVEDGQISSRLSFDAIRIPIRAPPCLATALQKKKRKEKKTCSTPETMPPFKFVSRNQSRRVLILLRGVIYFLLARFFFFFFFFTGIKKKRRRIEKRRRGASVRTGREVRI